MASITRSSLFACCLMESLDRIEKMQSETRVVDEAEPIPHDPPYIPQNAEQTKELRSVEEIEVEFLNQIGKGDKILLTGEEKMEALTRLERHIRVFWFIGPNNLIQNANGMKVKQTMVAEMVHSLFTGKWINTIFGVTPKTPIMIVFEMTEDILKSGNCWVLDCSISGDAKITRRFLVHRIKLEQ